MGLAYLPDGSRIDYNEYIHSHPHWKKVRAARFAFDGGKCVICHKDLTNDVWETHHNCYDHLGNEHMRDVVTMCKACHTKFHNNWQRQSYWRGREPNHWDVFDLKHTARLCLMYYREDRFICKDPAAPNLCNRDTIRQYIDDYFKHEEISAGVAIDPNDLLLFVRNKRYEMWFDAEDRGLTLEQFLDETYGEKIRGKNPLRQEAGKKGGTFDHKPTSFRRHYKENKNINILMETVKKEEVLNAET